MKNIFSKPTIGIFSIAMMSVAGIFSLRTLPLMAVYGFSSVFYYVLVAIIFFIPSSLICAELATGWPKTGGMYVWVTEAFGRRVGFLSIWLEWTNNVISFPATLAFIAATIAYAFDPNLSNHKYYVFGVMLIIFWGTTFINFLGIKFSSLVSNFGLILGTIFPCIFILVLGVGWMFAGKPIQIDFSLSSLIPDFKLANLTFIVGLILGYSGMQVSAFHAQEVENPQKNYPRAILIAVIVILFFSIFGSLAISIVVPKNTISVVTGLMQASEAFFTTFHMAWFVKVIAILTAIGTLASVNVWIIGPCKGLLASANNGDLPKFMQKINKNGAPTTLLLAQAIVGTIFSFVYLFMPTVSGSYWILLALTSLLVFFMYVLVFASAIYLRYKKPDVHRAYKIPGGNIGMWIVASIAILVCTLGFFLGFVPPAQLNTGSKCFYQGFLFFGVAIISLVPFVMHYFKKQD